MADKPKDKESNVVDLPTPVLTPEQVGMVSEIARQIARAEIAEAALLAELLAAEKPDAAWKHDADHGSIQSRRAAQRKRDMDAGLNGDDAGDM